MNTSEIDVAELPALSTRKDVAKWAGCSDRQIDLMAKVGKFPLPIRLGTHPRWRRSDLLNWLNAQTSSLDAD